LAGLFGAAAVTPGILFRVLPSREAVFAAFKKDPKKQLLAACSQLPAHPTTSYRIEFARER